MYVAQTKQAIRTTEVGRAGLVIRGISPILDKDGSYLGSVEAIMSFDSIVKMFNKEGIKLAVLMDAKYKRGNALT